MNTSQALEILDKQVRAASPMVPEDHRKWRRQASEAMSVIRAALASKVDAKPKARTAETAVASTGEKRRKKRGTTDA